MKTHEPTGISLNLTPGKSLALVLLAVAGVCAMMMTSLHTWTPGIELLVETPDGYQSARDFRTARRHDFPTLRDQPPPAPVAGAGHLLEVYDGKPYGTSGSPTATEPGPDVTTLYIRAVFGPTLVAHLDVPIDPRLHEHLRTLRKGAVVAVTGIGHGDGDPSVYIYPVHQVNGHRTRRNQRRKDADR